MHKFQIIRILFFVWACFISSYESYAQYTCNFTPIGGGGFVTGVITHQTSGDIYCRTDVGGVYRWDAVNSKWVQLMDWVPETQKGFSGVESMAVDPQNANNVYLLCGMDYFDNGKTAILKSTNKGNTFTVIDVTSKFKAHGNGMGRSNGERLSVDPHNSNILFCGTRRNGLWKSIDGGLTWNLAWNGVTTTTNNNGICFVLYDTSSSVVSGATQTIYIGVSRTGSANIYKSTDGGVTFTDISPITTFMPHRAALVGTTMYVVYADADGPWNCGLGRVYKLDASTGNWTNVTPNDNNYSYGGVSIDPSNANRVVVSTINKFNNNQYGTTWGDFVYLSTNGGTSWTLKNGTNSKYNNDGIGWASGMLHWAGSIEFTPGNTAEIRAVSGNGLFTCSNIDTTSPSWKFDVRGLEETGVTGGVSIPGGPFISVFGDITGFVHNDFTSYPAQTHQPADGSNWSVDYAAANTNKVVRVGSTKVYYSTNQGSTWTACPITKGGRGNLAISADGGTILHCAGDSSVTRYTTNDGQSWTNVGGVTISNAFPVSDRVNNNYFYIYNPSNGQMLVSANKGVSFSVGGNPGGSSAPWVQPFIRTVPGYEGHIWVPLIGNGLKYSTDHGATYTKITNVTNCSAVTIGKADVSATYPTVFIWGTVGGVNGMFRSTNKGANWIRVNDDAHQFGGTNLIFGDMNVFGRVYMSGTLGRGLIYFQIQDCNGVWGGTAYLDSCQTCVGGTTGKLPCVKDCKGIWGGSDTLSCTKDCQGIWGGGAFIDSCGTCVGGTTGKTACKKDCNGIWGGTAYKDNCNNCVGGNTGKTACTEDCNGVGGGTSYKDNCNNCVGGTTEKEACVKDCKGTWGGSAFIDNCSNCIDTTKGEKRCITNVDDYKSDSFNASPNPFTHSLQLHLPKSSEYKVINNSGEIVESGFCQNDCNIATNLLPGLYFLIIKNAEGVKTIKIIKLLNK